METNSLAAAAATIKDEKEQATLQPTSIVHNFQRKEKKKKKTVMRDGERKTELTSMEINNGQGLFPVNLLDRTGGKISEIVLLHFIKKYDRTVQ